MNPDEFQLILVDPKLELIEAWKQHFHAADRVSFVLGKFEELEHYDCLVSAANSFGIMDGGVDLAITKYFGVGLMRRVQDRILNEFRGEQNVGTSFIIETEHPKHPYLAHTPTMRIPMRIATTDYVYKAMWAMLLAVNKHNSDGKPAIATVACPGLGTATGRVPADEAARQMALAWRHFQLPPGLINWRYAGNRQDSIGRGGDGDWPTPPQ